MFGVLMLEQSWPFGENGTRFPSRLALAPNQVSQGINDVFGADH